MSVLALDVGGTKLAAAVVESDGTLASRAEVPTPPGGTADELWATLVDVAGTALGSLDIDGVGIGCGGPMSFADGRVSPLNIPGWRDFPLLDAVRDRWCLPTRLHNDAVTFALGEQRHGAAHGWRNVLGVVVSTGVGGGLILDGEVRDGPSGNAGHLGHVVVDPAGPACGCGGFGCVEAIARGPAIAEWAHATSAKALAQEGGPVAEAAFARAGRAVGIALAGAAALLDLDGIVIGGGLALAGDLLFGPLLAAYAEHARLPFTAGVPVVPAKWGRDAGLIGAACLLE